MEEEIFFIPILLSEHPYFSISCKECSVCSSTNWSHCNVDDTGTIIECDMCGGKPANILWN